MSLEFSASFGTVVGGLLFLHHGTSNEGSKSINEIGIDADKAFEGGGEGQFWCTNDLINAAYWAGTTMSESPKVLTIAIPTGVVTALIGSETPGLFLRPQDHPIVHFQFRPNSFAAVTQAMTIVEIHDAKPLLGK
jgi:hypothetical protein